MICLRLGSRLVHRLCCRRRPRSQDSTGKASNGDVAPTLFSLIRYASVSRFHLLLNRSLFGLALHQSASAWPRPSTASSQRASSYARLSPSSSSPCSPHVASKGKKRMEIVSIIVRDVDVSSLMAQKNGKKWVSFNASFTPPCQFFRGFRLFRPFLIFIVGNVFENWYPSVKSEQRQSRSPSKGTKTRSGRGARAFFSRPPPPHLLLLLLVVLLRITVDAHSLLPL